MRLNRLALLAAVLALLAPWAPAHAQKPQRAERPTYQVGDRWIRNDGVYELVRIEDDMYVFASGPGRQIHLGRDLAIGRVHFGERLGVFDPPPKLSWPLEVGKSGWGRVRWRGFNAPAGTMVSAIVAWKVEAMEPVQVAGTARDAFRVAFEVKWPARHGGSDGYRTWQLWYAPDAKQWVKGESEDLGFLRFAVVAIDQEGPAPLAVALQAPRDEERVAVPLIVLQGRATSGRGVARVTVSLNGAEIALPMPEAAEAAITLNVPLKLREGRNVVLVTAAEPGGATRQEARVVFYDKAVAAAPAAPPPVERPAPPPAPRVEPPKPEPVIAAAPPPPPLTVALTSPMDQLRVEQETIALAGLASGGRGVARVTVTLNGVEVKRVAEAQPLPALPVNLPLKLAEGTNTLVVTASDATGAVHQEVRTVVYEKIVPLSVEFRYPDDRAKVAQPTTVVVATVASSRGIASVSVTVNGAEVRMGDEVAIRDIRVAQRPKPEAAAGGPRKSITLTVPVTLAEGTNVIVVTATEPGGTARQAVRAVSYEKEVAAVVPAEPAAPPAHVRSQWAVVIGVGKYEASSIPTLRYSVADADAVYQTLIGPAGFKKDRVLLLTDKSERKPTLRNIKWALGTFLGRSAQKDDTVLIYYAGHGAPEVDTRGIERDGLAKYLIPSDADPDDLYSTALPMDEVQTIFGRIEAERVVVFLDACYSGAAGGRTFASKKTRAGAVDDMFLDRLTRSKGRAIITASRPSEVSIELPDLGHGIFTYYLVQGLRGAADLNRDGIVTLQELYEYLEQQVTQKSRAVGGNQHPVMKGELEGVLPLVKVGK